MATRFMGGYQRQAFFLAVSGLQLFTPLGMTPIFSKRTLAAVKSSGDAAQDDALWEATMDEVAARFLQGPYDVASLPVGSIISPRFGLAQRNKLRLIDNMSASGSNAAVGLPEKLQVEGVDEAVAVIRAWMMHAGGGCELLGKTYDLRKAYRQIGISESQLHAAWIAVWCPKESTRKAFAMKSMPFGATASVQAFLRLSIALKKHWGPCCSILFGHLITMTSL